MKKIINKLICILLWHKFELVTVSETATSANDSACINLNSTIKCQRCGGELDQTHKIKVNGKGNRAIVYGGKVKLNSGIWGLITDEGEVLATAYCHSCYFAAGSMLCKAPQNQEMLKERNITEFAWLEDCGISKAELLERNHKLKKGFWLESL